MPPLRARWFARPLNVLGPTCGAVAFALLASACSDGFGPDDVEGRYVLESVSSARLPVTRTGEGWSSRMIADTLWFSADEEGRRVQVVEWNDQPRARYESRFEFRVNEDRIEVTFACPPNASCIEGPHLLLTRYNGGLLATYPSSFQSRDILLYRDGNRD